MNDTYDTIMGLRAIRSFRREPLAPADLERILEAARWTGSSKNRQNWSFVVISEQELLNELALAGDFTEPIRSSVTTIAIVQEPGGYEFDSGRVAQNMMLAAESIGVASCPITLHREGEAAATLGLPPTHRCRYAVAFGYPSEDASAARFGGRKPLADLVHEQRFRPPV